MTFEKYWETVLKQKPIKNGQKVIMSKDEFRRMQHQAFLKGMYLGAIQETPSKSPNINISIEISKIFKELFGK